MIDMARSSNGCKNYGSEDAQSVYRCDRCGEVYCSDCGDKTVFSGIQCPNCHDTSAKFLGSGRYWED